MKKECCFFGFVFVLSAIFQPGCTADEPLWITSYQYQPFFNPSHSDQLRKWVKQFTVDPESRGILMERIQVRQAHIDTKYVDNLSASAMANIVHVTASGKEVDIPCWKVHGPEALVAKRDERLGRMDGTGTIENRDGFVLVHGKQTVVERDGGKEISGWLPFILFYHNGWLFQSSNEEFVNWKPSGDLVRRLNQLADRSWFRESQPTKVSSAGRQALLAGTFAVLGTRQQRMDGESDAAFAKRAGPHALWELFLKTQFFHTDSISGWRSRVKEGQKVRYFYEVTAEEGSEFAEVLKQFRHRTLMASPKLSWCSAAASVDIPPTIGSQLASLIPSDLPSPMSERIAVEVARSLQSGSLHMGSWLQKNDDATLLNGVTRLHLSGSGGSAASQASGTVDDESGDSLFVRQEITPDGILESQLGKTDPRTKVERPSSNAGALPVIFSAKLNVLELAQIGRNSDEFDLYAYCQDHYVKYLSPKYPKFPFPVPYKVMTDDAKALDQLRDKIVGDDAERWTVSISVSVHSRKRQLAIRMSVGDQLYGFLTVAENYWEKAANNAVDLKNIGR